jgi:murein DD-endopeptidase MepM/ murein hydrolase activator NlpD
MSYILPVDAPVTDDWQAHKDRGSAEPGTDYACAYGTPIRAVQGGVVSVVDDNPEGAEGRRLSIDLIDGTRVSYIHLDRIDAYVGQHVTQGQTGLALTGASGHGSNYGYNPHLHLTLWESPGMPYWDTIDFELYLGPVLPGPTVKDDDMPQFFEPNTIVWPNGWANSYDKQVYEAMKGYSLDPTNPGNQWVRDTWVRESWAALAGVQQQQVKVAQESVTANVAVGLSAGALFIALLGFVLRR